METEQTERKRQKWDLDEGKIKADHLSSAVWALSLLPLILSHYHDICKESKWQEINTKQYSIKSIIVYNPQSSKIERKCVALCQISSASSTKFTERQLNCNNVGILTLLPEENSRVKQEECCSEEWKCELDLQAYERGPSPRVKSDPAARGDNTNQTCRPIVELAIGGTVGNPSGLVSL